MTWIFHLLS